MMTFKRHLRLIGACQEAWEWVGSRTAEETWEQCNRPDWLLWWVAREKGNKIIVVKVVAKIARTVMHLNKDPKVLGAIKAAEKWANNPTEENEQAATAAANAAYAATDVAAANVADAAYDAADAAAHAAYAVAHIAATDAYVAAAATAAANAAATAAARAAADAAYAAYAYAAYAYADAAAYANAADATDAAAANAAYAAAAREKQNKKSLKIIKRYLTQPWSENKK